MSLPFIKIKRQAAGIATEYRKPDHKEEQDPTSEGLEAACEEMLKAFAASDKRALASAFKSAFQILEMEPHEEMDQEEEME